MKTNVYLVVVLMLLANGCASQEELARARAERAIARQAPFCESLGYQRGSDGWRQCIFAREQQRESQERICTVVYGSVVCN